MCEAATSDSHIFLRLNHIQDHIKLFSRLFAIKCIVAAVMQLFSMLYIYCHGTYGEGQKLPVDIEKGHYVATTMYKQAMS